MQSLSNQTTVPAEEVKQGMEEEKKIVPVTGTKENKGKRFLRNTIADRHKSDRRYKSDPGFYQRDQIRQQEKEEEKMQAEEKAEICYATTIQKLCLCSFLNNKITSEAEIRFSDFEAEMLKLAEEIATVKQWLKVISSLQESEARIKELENTFMEVEGDIYQLQTMLKKVTLDIKMACGRVPLSELKIAAGSRDEFLSRIQELSNIRNEIISILKPHEDSNTFAAQNVDTCVSTALQLRSLIKHCSSLTSVFCSYYRTLSLKICLKHRGQAFQENNML